MDITTKLSIAYRMYKNNLPIDGIKIACNVDKTTIYRWFKKFKYLGFYRTVAYYQELRKHKRKRKVNPIIKLKVLELRKKHNDCCGQKIKHYLFQEEGIKLSLTTIYKILNSKYQIKQKYKKNKYGEAPKGFSPRDVIQADTVDFGDLFAFTYVDTFTREAFVELEENLESISGKDSLIKAHSFYKEINLLQTDGGPEFKGEFEKAVLEYANKHRVSRPYKKNEQSYIESFNRSLRKECLGWRKYDLKEQSNTRQKVKDYLEYYNNERAHLSLNMMTPNQFLQKLQD